MVLCTEKPWKVSQRVDIERDYTFLINAYIGITLEGQEHMDVDSRK